ncbi:peptide-methionine (S)-S-oxide reductase MsrA [Vibrio sp. SCSIO 43137]|uniref:peptide-methionine (S)-S-oxide reductase MsrA n=1 Tax=Vibrio sp. SCSIO 43137 TaxID=3021011 RepID=UPI002306DE4A|nr:peptide-methionine (S)-S-oxide reductase MsrA [Vibrio sp. SCSIO 43137]WCE29427.1 peptide-methionine (S)-S-oxide reductase MsrA [Vibrio sp. SCSIO 43137]
MLNKQVMVTRETAIKGREQAIPVTQPHFVNNTDLTLEPAEGQQQILFGMGCFWGAERLFWNLKGVVSTSVGYSGGFTENPTYQDVCTGETGHTEVVRVIFDPSVISLSELLNQFWERHDPTQGMRQGNDLGTQYRSAIYVYSEQQKQTVLESKQSYQSALSDNQRTEITTEVEFAGPYYFAEEYHQQYLAKNPEGYCGLGGTGVCFPS